MTIDATMVGRSYTAAESYQVGREKIREFADAIGDANPVYRDPAAAKAFGHPDVVAPPTFPIVISMPAADQVVYDTALGLDWARVVHGDQRFTHERPMRPGDRVVAVVTVDSIKSFAGNDMITLVTVMSTVEGELITTARALLVARAEAGSEEQA